MALRIVLGLLMTVAAAGSAGRRLWWLGQRGLAGQPAPERIEAVRSQGLEGLVAKRLDSRYEPGPPLVAQTT